MQNILLVDTGDALIGGGALGDRTRGEAVIEGMNLMGYDAMALGPKELSLGPEVLALRIQAAEFAVLSANAVLSDGTPAAKPYAIVEVGGRPIGLIGLTALPPEPVPGFSVLEPGLALAGVLPEVRAQADTVVVVTNLGYEQGRALAGTVTGVDLLIAARPDQLPTQVVRVPGTGTLVVAAEQPVLKHTGRRVGRLFATMAADGSLHEAAWQSVTMTKDFQDDPEMAQLLDAWSSRP